MFAGALGKSWPLHEQRKILGHQVDPVHQPVCFDLLRQKVGRITRQLRLVHQKRRKRKASHERVVAGPVAAWVDYRRFRSTVAVPRAGIRRSGG